MDKKDLDYFKKYQAEKLERVYIWLPKGEKDLWREAATVAGESLQGFIMGSVRGRIADMHKND